MTNVDVSSANTSTSLGLRSSQLGARPELGKRQAVLRWPARPRLAPRKEKNPLKAELDPQGIVRNAFPRGALMTFRVKLPHLSDEAGLPLAPAVSLTQPKEEEKRKR
jgi:hypothetical protein